MKGNKFIYNLFWLVYIISLTLYLQSELIADPFEETSSVSNVIIIALFATSVIFDVFFSNFKKNRFGKTSKRITAFFFLFYFLSVMISLFLGFQSRNLYFLLGVPVFSFLMLKQIFVETENSLVIRVSLLVAFVFLLVEYGINYQRIFLYETMRSSSGIYILIIMSPVLLCSQKKSIRIIILFIMTVAVMVSFKRGAAFAFLVFFIIYYYYRLFYLQNRKISFRGIFALALISIVSFYVITRVGNATDDLMYNRISNIQEDEGSGRIAVWNSTLSKISQSTIPQHLFGHGFNSVARASRDSLSAHNDFLEVYFDFGIVGFIAYLMMISSLFKYGRYLSRNKSSLAAPFWSSFWSFIVISFISHIIIYPWLAIVQVLTWAYIISIEQIEYKAQLSNNDKLEDNLYRNQIIQ